MRLRKTSLGMTLIEIIIATAIAMVVMMALAMLLRQSQMVSFRALTKRDNLSQASQFAWIILSDFRSGSQTWLGNLQLNGDFETPQIPGASTPLYWPITNPSNGVVSLVKDDTLLNVRSGQYSIGLKANAGGGTVYISTNPLKLQPGAAYMITAWAKTENAATSYKISLVQASNDAEVGASAPMNSTGWSRLRFRYPATGIYVASTLVQDEAKLAVNVTGGTDQTYFDDVSMTPITAILVSSGASVINIPSAVTDVNDPADLAGYRFGRWENGALSLYRYRSTGGATPSLVREKFNPAVDAWEKAWSQRLGGNLVSLVFRYSSDNTVPATGKESVLEVEMAMRGDYTGKAKMADEVFTFQVSPTAP